MNAFIKHTLVALVWLFLSGNTSLGGLVIGWVAGYALLAAFQRALGCEPYVRRVRGFVIFVIRFIGELTTSSLRMAVLAVRPNAGALKGAFVRYRVEGLTTFEVLLLSHCISLTPGTTTVNQSEDQATLILHAFPADEGEQLQRHIDRTLKDWILAFTR
jgi:multisubunit Na+/H+ antiporter MnhE subunit